jgi:hypothetical protein
MMQDEFEEIQAWGYQTRQSDHTLTSSNSGGTNSLWRSGGSLHGPHGRGAGRLHRSLVIRYFTVKEGLFAALHGRRALRSQASEPSCGLPHLREQAMAEHFVSRSEGPDVGTEPPVHLPIAVKHLFWLEMEGSPCEYF